MSEINTDILLKKIDMVIQAAKPYFSLSKYSMIINFNVYAKNISDGSLIVDVDAPIELKEIKDERA